MAGIYLIAAISPGPNVLLVISTASTLGRRPALAAASGVAAGGTLWAMLATFGIAGLVTAQPSLEAVLSVLCGMYLLRLGVGMSIVGAAGRTEEVRSVPPERRALFRAGLMTNATNPKAVAFFATAVTAVVPSESSAWMLLAVVLVIASCSLAWHAALAMTFSAGPARRVYRSAEGLLTRVVGIVLMLLGIELVVRALELVR